MPITDGKYVAPTWMNNAAPPISADELQAMSDTIAASQGVYLAIYGVTTYEEIETAYNAGKACFCVCNLKTASGTIIFYQGVMPMSIAPTGSQVQFCGVNGNSRYVVRVTCTTNGWANGYDIYADNGTVTSELNSLKNSRLRYENGTYVGTGEKPSWSTFDPATSSDCTELTLSITPVMLIVTDVGKYISLIMVSSANGAVLDFGNDRTSYDYSKVAWLGKTVRWGTYNNATSGMNESGKTYYYTAIGI